MPSTRFRWATLADVPTLAAHVHDAYRGAASRAGWTTEADLLDGQRTDVTEIATIVSAPHREQRMLLATHDEQLVGSLHMARHGDALHLGMIAVLPTRQAQGIGRALLAEAERIARSESFATLHMEVIAQRSELIAWYERRGFVHTAERSAFPYGQPRYGLPRRPDLFFTHLTKPLR